MPPRASIIIVTRNRREELARALRSCLTQTGNPEILVIDDGSEDGSAEMVRNQFPTVHLTADPVSQGYIVQRNRAAGLASTDFLVSIDDDAEFTSPDTVAVTLADFVNSPRIAAVAIPFTESPQYEREFQLAPDSDGCWITAHFIGTAYAIRRDLFLELGGFDESLVHQGEERDFCIRLLNIGSYVRLGNAAPIHHHRSARRDLQRMAFYGRRNDLRFAWKHIPFPQVFGRIAGTTAKGLFHGFRTHTLGATLRGILAGYACMFQGVKRSPVSRSSYSAHRRLRSVGPELLLYAHA